MKNKLTLLLSISALFCQNITAQENAGPSMHLTYVFESDDAIVKMQKVKIVQSAPTSFFEVNWFRNGYTGLQQTPDPLYSTPNIFISSLWDLNTQDQIYAQLEYSHPNTITSRFGGEGDGEKTINQYGWQLNKWYNIVNRAWKANNRLYIATFIQNIENSEWLHTSSFSIPDTDEYYMYSVNDAFLENWDGTNRNWDGRFARKVYYKDIWNLTPQNTWETNVITYASVNDSQHDINRNGNYHNSFNANLDSQENAYFMEHGGSVTPSSIFNGTRTAYLNLQDNRGTSPEVTTGEFLSISATYTPDNLVINWNNSSTQTPQLNYTISITNNGENIYEFTEIKPEARTKNIALNLTDGEYTITLSGNDIFNQNMLPITKNITIVNGLLNLNSTVNATYKLWPNPTQEILYIESDQQIQSYRITDNTGKLIQNGKVNSNNVNVSTLAPGKYLISLDSNKSIPFIKK